MRSIAVTRYVTPLREGGSMPAIVEADDDGMYVLKFRGAGQGAKALVAEVIAGGIARALGLPMPDLALAELDPELARTEAESEIQHLIRSSAGTNLAVDYLPGSINFDPVAGMPDATLASAIVWFDALVTNVDRTARNTNLLRWHKGLWLIDHGAALYFHHDWANAGDASASPFKRIADHVLLPVATGIAAADAALAAKLDAATLAGIIAKVPDRWFTEVPEGDTPHFATADEFRAAYLDYLVRRLATRQGFVQEAIDAHARAV